MFHILRAKGVRSPQVAPKRAVFQVVLGTEDEISQRQHFKIYPTALRQSPWIPANQMEGWRRFQHEKLMETLVFLTHMGGVDSHGGPPIAALFDGKS